MENSKMSGKNSTYEKLFPTSGFEQLVKISDMYTDIWGPLRVLQENMLGITTISNAVKSIAINNWYNPMTELFKENKKITELVQSMNKISHLDMIRDFKFLYDIPYVHSISNVLDGKLLLHIISEEISNEEGNVVENVNSKIVSEILSVGKNEVKLERESPIIVVSPINDKVLKFLSENPQEMYGLTAGQFENFMAELYKRLGYNIEKTKATRDGGKDIIIRKSEKLGDFVYYVECKKYSKKNPIGVGFVRNLAGTVAIDKVNGGILATTSFFTKDAREFILKNNMQYQIKLQDYNDIQGLMNQAIQIT